MRETSGAIKERNIMYAKVESNIRAKRVLPYLMVGTFGCLPFVPGHSAQNSTTLSTFQTSAISTPAELSLSAGRLAQVRKVLKLSVTELASMFGVTRQAVHEWARGSTLQLKNEQRLLHLANVADRFHKSGLEIAPSSLRRKINDKPSIVNAFTAGEDVANLANELLITLTREDQQRKRLNERLAGRPLPVLSSSDFGAPHFNENV